ncbi:hypothetical protein CsSME_00021140 [Camellia sinensis var. sinensis]
MCLVSVNPSGFPLCSCYLVVAPIQRFDPSSRRLLTARLLSLALLRGRPIWFLAREHQHRNPPSLPLVHDYVRTHTSSTLTSDFGSLSDSLWFSICLFISNSGSPPLNCL